MTATAEEAVCRSVLGDLKRLAVVTTRGMDDSRARLRRYERAESGAPWRPVGASENVVVGSGGLAWGHPYRSEARAGEPVKTEGDRRSPAGIYRIGRSFGFAASARAGHLVLEAGRSICVDDPGSPDYNTIVAHDGATPPPKGEDMGAEPLYRHGLVIDYPSDATSRAGSCIFLHIWQGPEHGTAGCVAMPEARVAAMQDFFAQGGAVAILPEHALPRFRDCLPDATGTK